MATPLTIIQLRCPACSETMWVLDHVVRGTAGSGGRERPFPSRTYTCRHCKNHGTGFAFQQKAPTGFLTQPNAKYPMGRKAFRHWLEILQANFPDYFRLRSVGTRFYPHLPTLQQQTAGALSIMSFMLDSRNGPRRYGNQAFKMDRVCLTILFEHHARRLFNIPPAHTEERLVDHIDGRDVEILSDSTLRRMVMAVFAEGRKVVTHRPTFEHWKEDPYFAVGLDAYNRFAHQVTGPPLPDPDNWQFLSTRQIASESCSHTRLWWPVEDVL